MTRLVWLAVLGLCACAGSAAAQPAVDTYGYAGYGRVTEDEGLLGAGMELGGAFDLFLTRRTYLEAQVTYQRIARDFHFGIGFIDPRTGGIVTLPVDVALRGGATFVTSGIGHLFTDGPAAPFIGGEIGFVHYDQRPSQIVNAASLPPDLDPPGSLAGPGHRADAISLAFNAGVRIRLASRWLVRPQFAIRLANTGEFGPKYMIRAGVAGGVSW